MRLIFALFLFSGSFLTTYSFQSFTSNEVEEYYDDLRLSFSESECTSSHYGEVKTYNVYDGGSLVGSSIWLKRSSKRVKAKYFAYKQHGQTVHERYDSWRQGKEILLMSSGAYAVGWKDSDVPIGVTVDAGKIVNRNLESSMDGLVIVEAVGGVRVSDIDAGDLKLLAIDALPKDIRNVNDKARFLSWSQSEYATVFQSHLLIYGNNLKVYDRNNRKARRKFLILATDASGDVYHIIFYLKSRTYNLYESAEGLLRYFNNKNMNLVGVINLDTGNYDVLSTGSDVRDCSDDYITGTRNSNRQNLTNMLVYYYD